MLIDLLEAVVDELNTAQLSQAFKATRHYLPKWNVSKAAPALRVKVAFGPVDRETADREGRTESTVQVGIGISRKITSTKATEDDKETDQKHQVDKLVALVEEIAAHFDPPKSLTNYDSASAVDVRIPTVYDWEELHERNHFFAQVNVTFEVVE